MKVKNIILFLLFLFMGTTIYAQNTVVRGKVLDVSGEPLIGATVQEIGNRTNGAIADNDAIIFANFRPDRAIQMSNVFTADVYDNFKPADKPQNIHFVCMMRYADTVNGDIAFHSLDLSNTLGDYLSAQGLKQLRIAETEKYAHVTFFMDGGVDKEIEGATRVLINSPKVATND